MSADELHYDDRTIAFLADLWGDGYMSPGGPEEVARLLEGTDLAGLTVMDIGSGAGGITLSLARDYGAGRVIGIDVEEPVCRTARARIEAAGFADRIEIRQVAPGPFPVEDGSLDVVFSKDSIIHIEDKEWLAREAFRVLRPGGRFIASDWLISHDDTPSPEMAHYIACEDLGFGMASPDRYRRALADAGFEDIELVNRNEWYREEARRELARLTGPERPTFEASVGAEEIARQIRTWEAMVIPLDTGEHCPHHFRARKP